MSSPDQEQAQKCVDIAQKAMDVQDWSKAERFLEKSMKFEKTNKAQNLLYKLDTMRRRATEEQKNPKTPMQKEAKTPKREEPAKPQYTAKQVQLCREIIGKKNYYDILSVQKNATDDDLKRSYKKLAIKFHPDKNHAPMAAEAFKKVGAAYACLTDSDKRGYYDKTGEEPGNAQPQQRRFRRDQHESEINPEEIFNMFFGGGLFEQPQARRQRQQQSEQYRTRNGRAQRHTNNNGEEENPFTTMFRQFAPLLFVILLSLMTNLGESSSTTQQTSYDYIKDYKFSFQQSYTYPHKIVTSNLNQIYYVNQYTLYDFQRSMDKKVKTDDRVEQEVIRRLDKKCQESKKLRQGYLNQAKKYSENQEAYNMYLNKMEEVDMSFCKTLKEDQEILEQAQAVKNERQQQSRRGRNTRG